MSANYEHPIATDRELTITYPSKGPNESYATLHAEGCSHTLRAVRRPSVSFRGDESYGADDYFKVAPCARAKKGKALA